MKLLIIVLCLLSERYLIHKLSGTRFQWFSNYFDEINKKLPETNFFKNPLCLLFITLLPLILICWFALYFLGYWLFGIIGLLINLVVFYSCLGPENPFYPMMEEGERVDENTQSGLYFAKVNNELFAVIFWFILTGAVGVLTYRLLSLSQTQERVKEVAIKIMSVLDWFTARVTVMLYLLVGNFQQAFGFYGKMFLTAPENNEVLLSQGGLLAAQAQGKEMVTLLEAQDIVEVAVIVYLVFIAILTLTAWL